MPVLTIGGRDYRIRSWQRRDGWRACAVRLDTGDRHGPDISAESQERAVAAVTAWLEWQAAHAAALDDLQNAERAYHRCVADQAFAAGSGEAARQARRDALERLEQVRRRLDDIRERRPTLRIDD